MVFKLKRVMQRGTKGKSDEKADAVVPSASSSGPPGQSAGGKGNGPTNNGVVARGGVGGASAAGAPAPKVSGAPGVQASGVGRSGPGKMPNGSFEALPSFRDVPTSDRQSLFARKLALCCYTFDFTDPTKNVKEKEIKRQTLLELVDYVTSGSGKFTEAVFEDITKMLSSNLFRTLPPSSHENTGSDNFDPEEEEPTMEPAWPHLQIVYEFLLRYVVSSETDAKLAKRYIDHSFVLRLLELFDSEDPREREYLKTILHRIYGKFMVHRPFIRKAINNIFYRFIFETEKHNGVAELLEILGSIINGFALPLKEEHKMFLVRALIPLHKPKCVSMYHQQLSYCIIQFVEKDFKLADVVIRGLLRYWPVTNSQKEVLFLGELEEVLEATQSAEFQRCMVPLFRQIGRCLNSSHFQVLGALRVLVELSIECLLIGIVSRCTIFNRTPKGWDYSVWKHPSPAGDDVLMPRIFVELNRKDVVNQFSCSRYGTERFRVATKVAERALFLWNNDHIVSLVAQNRQVVLPIIFPALERNTRSHWNQAVHGLTLNVRKMFLEMDQELFQECQRKYQEDEAKAKGIEETRELTWKRLEVAGNQRSNSNLSHSLAPSDGVIGMNTVLNKIAGSAAPVLGQSAVLGK